MDMLPTVAASTAEPTVDAVQPLTIVIAALGGEGGSVLMNWIVAAAKLANLPVQATSVPGVAQRTGATSYYIEMFPRPAPPGVKPIFALMPMAGRVDVVLASELVEAGRMMERGFVSPKRTTLITSTSRVYATAEKIEMGDGRFDADKIAAASAKLARRMIALDLDRLARDSNTLISATLLGALAGSCALPLSPADFERAIGSGRSAAASIAGFRAAMDAVAGAGKPGTAAEPAQTKVPPAHAAQSTKVIAPADSHLADLPSWLREIAGHGMDRVVDFQDAAYGELYLTRVRRLVASAPADDPLARHAVVEAARRLALWMAYEDVPRVADLKIRRERFDRIKREAEIAPGQVLHVVEYLKPGAEEIAAMLPAPIGRAMMKRVARGGWFPFLGRGIHVRSTGVAGHLMLRLIASFKHLRRQSLRFPEEQAAIEVWLGAMATSLHRSPPFAAALAELPRVLKGYSDTHVRGRRAYGEIMSKVVQPALASAGEARAAPQLRRAIAAALADPEHKALDRLLANGRS